MTAYLKAINPAIITLIGVFGTFVAGGTLDRVSLAVATVGTIHATLAFFVSNVPGWTFLKNLVPPLINGLGIVGLLIQTGEFDRGLFAATVTALGLAAVTALSSNTDEPVGTAFSGGLPPQAR